MPVTCSALASGLALALRRSRRAGSKTRKHPVNDLLSTRQWGPRARVEVGQGSPHKYLQLYKDRDHRLRGDSLGSQHDLASVCCCPPAAGGFSPALRCSPTRLNSSDDSTRHLPCTLGPQLGLPFQLVGPCKHRRLVQALGKLGSSVSSCWCCHTGARFSKASCIAWVPSASRFGGLCADHICALDFDQTP